MDDADGMNGADGVDGVDGDDGSPGNLPPGALRPAPIGAANPVVLNPIARIETQIWDDGAAEIVVFDPDTDTDQACYINAAAGLVQVADLSTPASPTLVATLDKVTDAAADATSTLDGINSVAVANGVVAVAVEADPSSDPGVVAFYNASTLAYLGAADVGALPDSVVFTPDGSRAIVANEGEPNLDNVDLTSPGTADLADIVNPEGTVSIITVPAASGDFSSLTVQTADFTAFNGTEDALESQGASWSAASRTRPPPSPRTSNPSSSPPTAPPHG